MVKKQFLNVMSRASALTPLGVLLVAASPLPALAVADPASLTTVSGATTSTLTAPGHLLTQQHTDRAIIQGANVDVLGGESWNIMQPSSGSALLVRVTGGQPTQILGTMNANGQVMLVNGAGVFFGQGSQVNVAGLVASTADIANERFNAGQLVFDRPGRADASIINKGTITAKDGGLVALLAPGVRNDGVIAAKGGTVALAGGEAFAVDFYGDGLYSFSVTKEASAKAKDENGKAMNSAVENNGTVKSGVVVMSARVAQQVVDNAINTTGLVEATSLEMNGGQIVLDGGAGNVRVAGNLKASGKKGGKVQVTSTENITLASDAYVDVSGSESGGIVRIGGDAKGAGTLDRAKSVDVAQSAFIKASGNTGNGGDVVVWSDNATNFEGGIDISSQQGNGGFAEVSSKEELTYKGFTDARGVQLGTLLLDPGNWTISAGATTGNVKNVGELVTQLNAANVIIDTAAATNQAGHQGDITVSSAITWTGPGSLTLNALRDIKVNNNIRSLNNTSGTNGALTLTAGRDITFTNSVVNLLRGDLTANSRNLTMNNSLLQALGGNMTLNNSGVYNSNLGKNIIVGGNLNMRQNIGGSIQNALDSVNVAFSSYMLTVGDGVFNENVRIDNRMTLQSMNGAGSTTIAGVAGAGQTGTVSIKSGVTDVVLGTANKGFTVVAQNNGNPLVANAALNLLGGNSNTRLEGNIIQSGNGLTGLLVNDSANVQLATNTLEGAGSAVGVRLSGAGTTDFGFSDDQNSFDGHATYFSLENGAMNGQTLDASQQTFAAVRGVDMDETQYNEARSRTVDSDSTAGVGFVYYRDAFTAPAGGPDSETLDLLLQRNTGVLRSVFSYSGKTVESSYVVAPYSFSVQGVNLSLLAPNAGGGNTPPAPNPANPDQLAGLAPAAGAGTRPLQAAAADESCANGFLSDALNPGNCFQQ